MLASTTMIGSAGINEMVAKLAEKSDKADALLREVAQNVKEGKQTTMDPALTDEVKRLLGCAEPTTLQTTPLDADGALASAAASAQASTSTSRTSEDS